MAGDGRGKVKAVVIGDWVSVDFGGSEVRLNGRVHLLFIDGVAWKSSPKLGEGSAMRQPANAGLGSARRHTRVRLCRLLCSALTPFVPVRPLWWGRSSSDRLRETGWGARTPSQIPISRAARRLGSARNGPVSPMWTADLGSVNAARREGRC